MLYMVLATGQHVKLDMPVFCHYDAEMQNDKKPPSRTQRKFVVRMPDGMRERIAALAKKNQRTMNAEIVLRLRSTLEKDEKIEDQVAAGELLERIFRGIGQLSAEQIEVLRTLCSSLEKKR